MFKNYNKLNNNNQLIKKLKKLLQIISNKQKLWNWNRFKIQLIKYKKKKIHQNLKKIKLL